MITYNHEAFLAEALESVLAQQTDFVIEVVVGEDCSTDRTRDILKKYAQSHPGVVRPVLHEKNVGVGANFDMTFAAARGKYVAFLEGDDYWSDSTKLARQVAWLERDAEIRICFHPVLVVGAEHHLLGKFMPAPRRWRAFWPVEELFEGNFVNTCSVVMPRAAVPEFGASFAGVVMRDWPIFIFAAQTGKIAFLDEPMACYRIHGGGVWTGEPPLAQVEMELAMWDVMRGRVEKRYRRLVFKRCMTCHAARLGHLAGAGRMTRLRVLGAWICAAVGARVWRGRAFCGLLGEALAARHRRV